MKIDRKKLEQNINDALSDILLNSIYEEEEVPNEIIETTGAITIEMFIKYFPQLTDLKINSTLKDNIILVNIEEEEEISLIDIIYTIKYLDNNSKKFIIVNVLTNVKDYFFDEVLKQNSELIEENI